MGHVSVVQDILIDAVALAAADLEPDAILNLEATEELELWAEIAGSATLNIDLDLDVSPKKSPGPTTAADWVTHSTVNITGNGLFPLFAKRGVSAIGLRLRGRIAWTAGTGTITVYALRRAA